MHYVLQSKRGIGGDCLAACLASIFEVDLASIPDMAPPECIEDWTIQPKLRREWLRQRGLDYLEIDIDKQSFHWTSEAVPTGPCLFAVKSKTPECREKGYGHFVVGELRVSSDQAVDYAILHDPLGEDHSPYEITAIGLFIALHPYTHGRIAPLKSATPQSHV